MVAASPITVRELLGVALLGIVLALALHWPLPLHMAATSRRTSATRSSRRGRSRGTGTRSTSAGAITPSSPSAHVSGASSAIAARAAIARALL